MRKLSLALSALLLLAPAVSFAGDITFPHVATGPHYVTELKITNHDLASAGVSLVYFTPEGRLADFSPDGASFISIPPQATAVVKLKRGSQNKSGWVRAQSSAAVSGLLQISYLAGPATSSMTSFDNLRPFAVARISGDNDLARRTGFAVCNPNNLDLTLDLELFSKTGQSVGKVVWTLARLEQRARYIDELGVPGAHSVEISSRSGLFSALSVAQTATEMITNPAEEVLQKRFVMQQEKMDLPFKAFQVRVRGHLAVVTSENGVNILDLRTKTVLGNVPLDLLARWPNVAFHPSKPLVAVAGRWETLIINLDNATVVKRLTLVNAAVAYDNLTETLITGGWESAALATRTRVQTYTVNFDPIAEYLYLYGPGWLQARNGILAVSPNSLDFALLRVPSLEVVSSKSLPLGAITTQTGFASDNVIVFGPERGPMYPPGTAEYLLSLYYIESGRIETLAMGEPFSAKVVSNNRVYLARDLFFKVVDLVQRRVIYQTLLLFAPIDMDAYQEASALVAIDQTSRALWVLRLSAQ